MKLQDIDFGVGFGDRIMLGVKDARKLNCFEGQPIDITERFERVMLNYSLEIKENNETLYTAKKRYEVILKGYEVILKEVE